MFDSRVRFALVAGVILIGVLACGSPTPRLIRATVTPVHTFVVAPTPPTAPPVIGPTLAATVTPTPPVLPALRTETPKVDAKPMLEVADVVCNQGQESDFDVRLSLIEDGGLAGFDMTLILEPESLGRFVSVEFPNQGFGISNDLPDSSIKVSYLNTERSIQPGDLGTRIVSIRLLCAQPGIGEIKLKVLALDDERGATIEVDVRDGRVVVNN